MFVAVTREIVAIHEENEILEERTALMAAKTEHISKQLEDYCEQLQERVSEYIAQDIADFLTGFDFMDRGLMSGDSDMVIKGNVVIQRVMGREIQFTNQQEFDKLMVSDEPLRL